jgi:hypothetical protein
MERGALTVFRSSRQVHVVREIPAPASAAEITKTLDASIQTLETAAAEKNQKYVEGGCYAERPCLTSPCWEVVRRRDCQRQAVMNLLHAHL